MNAVTMGSAEAVLCLQKSFASLFENLGSRHCPDADPHIRPPHTSREGQDAAGWLCVLQVSHVLLPTWPFLSQTIVPGCR
jgi:hypothetical protein